MVFVASDLLLHLNVAFGLPVGLVLVAAPGPPSTHIVSSCGALEKGLQPNRSVGGAVGLSKSLTQTRQATCLSSTQGIIITQLNHVLGVFSAIIIFDLLNRPKTKKKKEKTPGGLLFSKIKLGCISAQLVLNL